MRAVIIYESVFGNTHQVAEAIAEGLRSQFAGADVACLPVSAGTAAMLKDADLLVVGGPTHMRGVSSGMSRRKGAEGEQQKTPDVHVESGSDGPGLRDWFKGLDRPARPAAAAAFDTRIDVAMAGGAAPGIARRLRHHGYRVLAAEGFIVDGTHGPLRDRELERAREWGAGLSRRFAPAA
jgi:Flavodoxin